MIFLRKAKFKTGMISLLAPEIILSEIDGL